MSVVVRCRENNLEAVPAEFLDVGRGYGRSTALPLSVGKLYVVYAVAGFVGGFWYYVFDDDDHGYPVWYPAAVFDVVSGKVPDEWELRHHRTSNGGVSSILSFSEWASDPHFYERLVDGEYAEVQLLEEMRGSEPVTQLEDPPAQ